MAEKIVEENIFETLQFPYNIVEDQGEKLFGLAKDKNIGIIVMKPLAGGAIFDAKIAIKHILRNNNISVIIPGMESIEQVRENNSVIGEMFTSEDENKVNKIKDELTGDFCRRCGYCMPCSVGINIPFCFLVEGYYSRYNLKDWAISRYQTMPIKPNKCIECGECEKKCPYNLKIIKKLKMVNELFGGKNE
jgi:predicted aldo/keto reductase-like oxidoreductase